MIDERNGVRLRTPRTQGALAWAIFDEIGPFTTIKQALVIARERKLNENNIRTELCRWRKFYSVRI